VLTEPDGAEAASGASSNVVDLMSLLKQSLDKRQPARADARTKRSASVTPLRRTKPAAKSPARTKTTKGAGRASGAKASNGRRARA
jgi:non-homologous end joining protein Ku